MVRVISQETFDAVVKENVEDLDMSPEDAVKEAKEQFEAQVWQAFKWKRIAFINELCFRELIYPTLLCRLEIT